MALTSEITIWCDTPDCQSWEYGLSNNPKTARANAYKSAGYIHFRGIDNRIADFCGKCVNETGLFDIKDGHNKRIRESKK